MLSAEIDGQYHPIPYFVRKSFRKLDFIGETDFSS